MNSFLAMAASFAKSLLRLSRMTTFHSRPLLLWYVMTLTVSDELSLLPWLNFWSEIQVMNPDMVGVSLSCLQWSS